MCGGLIFNHAWQVLQIKAEVSNEFLKICVESNHNF